MLYFNRFMVLAGLDFHSTIKNEMKIACAGTMCFGLNCYTILVFYNIYIELDLQVCIHKCMNKKKHNDTRYANFLVSKNFPGNSCRAKRHERISRKEEFFGELC